MARTFSEGEVASYLPTPAQPGSVVGYIGLESSAIYIPTQEQLKAMLDEQFDVALELILEKIRIHCRRDAARVQLEALVTRATIQPVLVERVGLFRTLLLCADPAQRAQEISRIVVALQYLRAEIRNQIDFLFPHPLTFEDRGRLNTPEITGTEQQVISLRKSLIRFLFLIQVISQLSDFGTGITVHSRSPLAALQQDIMQMQKELYPILGATLLPVERRS